MVATHGNEIEPIPYLPRKGAKIHEMRVWVSSNNQIKFELGFNIEEIPNNSEAEV
jgi:hypothetical protein